MEITKGKISPAKANTQERKHQSIKQPSTKLASTKQPSTKLASIKQPSTKLASIKQPSTTLASIKQPSTKLVGFPAAQMVRIHHNLGDLGLIPTDRLKD